MRVIIIFLIVFTFCSCSHINEESDNDNKIKVINPLDYDKSVKFNKSDFIMVRYAIDHWDKLTEENCEKYFEAAKRVANEFDFKGMTVKELFELFGKPVHVYNEKDYEEYDYGMGDDVGVLCRGCTYTFQIRDGVVIGFEFTVSDE